VFLTGRSGRGGGGARSHCIAMAIISPQIMLDDQAKRDKIRKTWQVPESFWMTKVNMTRSVRLNKNLTNKRINHYKIKLRSNSTIQEDYSQIHTWSESTSRISAPQFLLVIKPNSWLSPSSQKIEHTNEQQTNRLHKRTTKYLRRRTGETLNS